VPGGSGGVRSAARGEEMGGGRGEECECEGGDAPSQGVLHVHGAAGVGQEQRLPVGCEDVCHRRSRRASGDAAVGEGTRLPVGREDVCMSCLQRAPGGVAVGAGARLPVGLVDVLPRRCLRASEGAAVGSDPRMPVGQAGLCKGFPKPPRDSRMGAGATIGQMLHVTHTQYTEAATIGATLEIRTGRAPGGGAAAAGARGRCPRQNYTPAPHPSGYMRYQLYSHRMFSHRPRTYRYDLPTYRATHM
jgi:hypothetical protein